MAEKQKVRIAKFIADAGVASRREAERMILAGHVSVNGVFIESPALNVGDADEVVVNGRPLKRLARTRLWALYKPQLVITSNRDDEGRTTVFDLLPRSMPRVITVGRLDYNSEGLLLLTNSGDFARQLELPSSAYERTYRVRIFGDLTQSIVDSLKQGVSVNGINYGSITVDTEKFTDARNQWVFVTLKEGKNREIRKVFEHFGLKVNRLIRTSYAGIELGKMRPGEVREIKPEEIALLTSGKRTRSRLSLKPKVAK